MPNPRHKLDLAIKCSRHFHTTISEYDSATQYKS